MHQQCCNGSPGEGMSLGMSLEHWEIWKQWPSTSSSTAANEALELLLVPQPKQMRLLWLAERLHLWFWLYQHQPVNQILNKPITQKLTKSIWERQLTNMVDGQLLVSVVAPITSRAGERGLERTLRDTGGSWMTSYKAEKDDKTLRRFTNAYMNDRRQWGSGSHIKKSTAHRWHVCPTLWPALWMGSIGSWRAETRRSSKSDPSVTIHKSCTNRHKKPAHIGIPHTTSSHEVVMKDRHAYLFHTEQPFQEL